MPPLEQQTAIREQAVRPGAPGSRRRTRWRRPSALAGLVVILTVAPIVALSYFTQAPYYLNIAVLILVYAIVAISVNAPIRSGYWPAGQAAFMAIGGYTSVVLAGTLHVPAGIGLVAGSLLAGVAALIIGRLTLRLAGVYFVLATFAFGEVVQLIIVNNTSLLGGPSGLTTVGSLNFLSGVHRFTVNSTSLLSAYYVAFMICIIAVLVLHLIYRSSIGRILHAMGSNIRLLESQGVNTVFYRVLTFTVSGVFAGAAGAILVDYTNLASPDMFGYILSVDVLIFNVVGGTRWLAGPIIGTILLTPLPEVLRGAGAVYAQIGYGAVVVAVVLIFPGGIISLFRRRSRTEG